MRTQKDPKRGHFPHQAPSQAPGLIGALLVAIAEATQAGIPCLPLSTRWWLVGHVAQALQCPQGRLAAGGEVGVASWRPATGSADEMGQTGLALVDPVLIDAVALTDQDALPLVDQGQKGVWGAMGINALGGHGIGAHDPEPLSGVLAVPGRFINVAHGRLVGQSRTSLMVGHDGLRDALDDFLHRAQADREVDHRVTDVLYQSPRGAMHAGEFSAQGTEARPITGLMVAWPLRFELPATALAVARLEDEMVHVHLDGWHLDDLMGVVGRQGNQVAMATGTGAGFNEMDLGGTQEGWPSATMAFLPAASAAGGFALAFGLVAGCIRRRGLAGGLRGLGQPFLQGLDVVLKLLDLALELSHLGLKLSPLLILALEVVLNGRWGELPLQLGKG
jgi:hypothetical protein